MAYTYDTLVADVIANMEEDSTEFVSALPTIVERAQAYIQKRVDTPQINRFTDVSVSASVHTLALPSDLLVLKSIQVCVTGGWSQLLQQTNEYLVAYWPDRTSCGTPKYYAPKDNSTIFLAPTPTRNAAAAIEYVPRVTVLTSAASTNWFSDNAESAFFAAAMMYANLWTKNAQAADKWKSVTEEELSVLNNEARRSRRGDATFRGAGSPENNIVDGV